jgi:hypothetical protein
LIYFGSCAESGYSRDLTPKDDTDDEWIMNLRSTSHFGYRLQKTPAHPEPPSDDMHRVLYAMLVGGLPFYTIDCILEDADLIYTAPVKNKVQAVTQEELMNLKIRAEVNQMMDKFDQDRRAAAEQAAKQAAQLQKAISEQAASTPSSQPPVTGVDATAPSPNVSTPKVEVQLNDAQLAKAEAKAQAKAANQAKKKQKEAK